MDRVHIDYLMFLLAFGEYKIPNIFWLLQKKGYCSYNLGFPSVFYCNVLRLPVLWPLLYFILSFPDALLTSHHVTQSLRPFFNRYHDITWLSLSDRTSSWLERTWGGPGHELSLGSGFPRLCSCSFERSWAPTACSCLLVSAVESVQVENLPLSEHPGPAVW